MYFDSIKLQNFRNFQDAEIDAVNGINLICGPNGSGKTSLLESLYYLSLARSFRTNKSFYIVNDQAKSFTLFSRIIDDEGKGHKLGIERDCKNVISMRFDGTSLSRVSELAKLLCVQFIAPQTLSLLETGPNERRAFIDWGCFYHFSDFCVLFSEFKTCLKQRNALLAQKADANYIHIWDLNFVNINEKINNYRTRYLEMFNKEFKSIISNFLPGMDFLIELNSGFRVGDFSTQLYESISREYLLGYSLYGCHKSDLKIKVNGRIAAEVLSRGQCKLLVIALKLAQGMIHSRFEKKSCIFLIDDIGAELDTDKIKSLFSFISSLSSSHQFFISCLEPSNDILLSSLASSCVFKSFQISENSILSM